MTEAAIDASVWRDLYIALGEPIGEDAWAVRLAIQAYGALAMAGRAWMIGLGALVTVLDRRYRAQVARSQSPAVGAVGVAVRRTVLGGIRLACGLTVV